MQTQLILLDRIQKIDLDITTIKKEKEGYPHKQEEVNESLAKLRSSIELISAAKADIEDQISRMRLDVSGWDEKIKRNDEKLRNIKNEKQYKALGKENNTAGRKKAEITKGLDTLAELNQAKQDELALAEEEFKAKQDELKALIRETEHMTERLESELSRKGEERAVTARGLSPKLLRRYELIKERRHGLGIVQAVEGTCQGCYLKIPPQQYIQLLSGNNSEIIVCPHCHRILYACNSTEMQ